MLVLDQAAEVPWKKKIFGRTTEALIDLEK